MLEGESKEVKCMLNGPGITATLVLKIPNTKNIEDLESLGFYKRFMAYDRSRIDSVLTAELSRLQREIEDYCYYESFITYESAPALELRIYSFEI